MTSKKPSGHAYPWGFPQWNLNKPSAQRSALISITIRCVRVNCRHEPGGRKKKAVTHSLNSKGSVPSGGKAFPLNSDQPELFFLFF